MSDSRTSGFVLSSHWQDVKGVLTLQYWVSTPNGPLRLTIEGQEAVFFVPQSALMDTNVLLRGISYRSQSVALKTFEQAPVNAYYFNNYRQYLRAREILQTRKIPCFETDIRPADRYLMERFCLGSLVLKGDIQGNEVLNPLVKKSDYWPQLSWLSLDIETAYPVPNEPTPLYSIAVLSESVKRVWMIGAHNDELTVGVKDEQALIEAFLDFIHVSDPDVLLGWNVVNFDLHFLQQRCDELGIVFSLGRRVQLSGNKKEAEPQWRTAGETGSNKYFVSIPGRVALDGIDLLKMATYSFESFSLESVATSLLNRGKLVHDVDNRAEEITQMFLHNKTDLAKYNLEDCQLVWDIFEKTHLLDFAIQRSRLTGLLMDRVGGSVAAFEFSYLPRLHRAGFVAPNMGDGYSDIKSPGGYVMDSIPGLYTNVLVLDFKSLYPSIIRTFKIDPMGMIKALEHEQPEELTADSHYIEGYMGGRFSKTEHFLPSMIADLWTARDEAKRVKDPALSQAIKIIMNSFYGVLGSNGCRFHDTRLASSITLRGHDIIQTTSQLIEAQGYKVIYGDTDSVFVWIEEEVSPAQADTIGQTLIETLNVWWKKECLQTHGIDCYLELEYETHYQQFVMPTIRGSDQGSKKRYAGLVNQSGEDKMVFKGLETVRTDWTPLAREFQKELYRRIFYKEPFEQYIKDTVASVKQSKCNHKLIYRKRLRRKLEDYQRNVPPHVRAAQKADAWLTSQNKAPRYQRGGWIEYVMTVKGPEPLEHHPSTLDYDFYIERQLEPVADGILHFLGKSFEEITNQQLGLF